MRLERFFLGFEHLFSVGYLTVFALQLVEHLCQFHLVRLYLLCHFTSLISQLLLRLG